MKKKYSEKLPNPAFTLAEVLITLAIIGVVAALTIPTVVRNYQKIQTVTKLKKVYSALSNTTNLAIAEHGPIQGWEIGTIYGGEAAQKFADTYMIPYLKVSKNCGIKTTGDCAFKYTNLSKNSTGQLGTSYTRFYLNDGTLIGLALIHYGNDPELNQAARVEIDINGQKAPNIVGKDYFAFDYKIKNFASGNGRFVPLGDITSSRTYLMGGEWGCNKNGHGSYCAALIMKDGWEIKDDYPW